MAPSVGLGTEGPVQRGWDLWIVSVVMVIVAGIFVIARFLERARRQGLGVDDYVILAALISSVLLSVTEIEAVVHGYGRHSATLPHAQVIIGLKWFFAAQVVYKLVITLDKVAILCMYYRIFQVNQGFRIAAHCVNAFIILSGIAYILATIFQCTPVSGTWNKTINPKCINSEAFWISYATINIFTDLVLLILPVRQVMRLKLSRLEKLGLCLVFCTGCFATVTSIVRTTTLASSAHDKDPTWGPLPATVWSVIEANAGIIAACLPTLRHPFALVFGPLVPQRFRPSAQGSGGQYNRSGGNGSNHRSGRSGRNSGLQQLSDNTAVEGSRGSFPTKSGDKTFEPYAYGYELDGHSSMEEQNAPSDSDSGPIVLQHPEDHKMVDIRPGQAYTTPYSHRTRNAPQQQEHLNPPLGKQGEIYVESDVNISVSHTSDERLDRMTSEGRGYYSYSGSGLRSGAGRQYSISASRTTSRDRERVEREAERQRSAGRAEPMPERDLGKEYYLRDIM
ncbi:hypothetical protein NA57DRAFT_77731 [Rhizodiscina lignyota]|uniref:Rhodopsin domain-containing protein n=1 Tax=Rhizodiscina lignyota TaxID=1504668 RepID=A0A9P4IEA5_9PEZI|nr:hypothetical protein NA57DRAFT_77731 [Rhizodiscina lignyota]